MKMNNLKDKIKYFKCADIEFSLNHILSKNSSLYFSEEKYWQLEEFGAWYDWSYLISTYNIPTFILDINSKYFSKQIWKLISRVYRLDLCFIEKYKYHLPIEQVYRRFGCAITEEFIENNTDLVPLATAVCLVKVSDGFIEKYMNELSMNMCSVIKFQTLSMEFIEKYSYMLDINTLSIYQQLSEEFIEKNAEFISWDNVSIYQRVSESFVEKHIDKIRMFYYLKSNTNLSKEFIQKYVPKLNTFESRYLELHHNEYYS